ncbi:MAG TPA: M56 family metallopeptidase [Phycisphaerae bacterium]|jgi:beta-lactamase regulating signal transducer with metallopeptidase domain
MNLIETSHPLWTQWGLTLVDFVWQGALLAALLAAALWLLRRRTPEARYAACGAALLAAAAAPLVTFTWHGLPGRAASRATEALPIALESTAELQTARAAATADDQAAPLIAEVEPFAARSAIRSSPAGATAVDAPVARMIDDRLARWLSIAALVWAGAVVLLGARLLCGWIGLHRLRRTQEPLPPPVADAARRIQESLAMTGRVRVRASRAATAPLAFGLLKPLVLLPAALLNECPIDVIEAMIAHELAHVRRHDLWINLLQRVVETLLFYHPAVWWISARMRLERELCCDDAAVAVTGRRDVYAHALLAASQAAIPNIGVLSAAMFSTRITLMTRIRRILQLPRVSDRTPLWPAGAVSLITVAALLVIPRVQGSGFPPRRAGGVQGSGLSVDQLSGPSDGATEDTPATARTAQANASAASAPAAQDEAPPTTSLVATDYKSIESYRNDLELQRRVVSLTTDVLRGYLGFATAVQRGDTAELLRRFRPEGRAAAAEDTAKLRADLQAIGFELQGEALSGRWAVQNIQVTDDGKLALVTPASVRTHYHGKEWWMQTDFLLAADETVGWVVESVSYHEHSADDAFYKRAGAEADQKHLDELIVWAIPLWGKRSASGFQSPYSRSKGVSTTRIGAGIGVGRTGGEFVPPLRDLDVYAAAGYPGVFADTVPAVRTGERERITVYSQADGIVARNLLKLEQPVKKGDLLVQLDDAEIAIELEAAKVRLKAAEMEFGRAKAQNDSGRTSGEELLKAETALRLAQIEVQRWELRLTRTRITSPADGIYKGSSRDISIGKKISAGDEVLTLEVAQPSNEPAGARGSAPQP